MEAGRAESDDVWKQHYKNRLCGKYSKDLQTMAAEMRANYNKETEKQRLKRQSCANVKVADCRPVLFAVLSRLA